MSAPRTGGIPADVLAMSGTIPDLVDDDGLGWWELTPVDPIGNDPEHWTYDHLTEEHAA